MALPTSRNLSRARWSRPARTRRARAEDRERVLDSPADKIMLSLTTFADELERVKARQRTYDAMMRKAKSGHVTGGRVFGYDNVRQDSAQFPPQLRGPDQRLRRP